MAIFYNYIKGCGNEAKNGSGKPLDGSWENLNTESWTFLKWANHSGTKTVDALPEVHISGHSKYEEPTPENIKVGKSLNLGKIITSDATGQKINKPFTFAPNASITCEDNLIINKQIDFINATNYIKGVSREETTESETTTHYSLEANTEELKLIGDLNAIGCLRVGDAIGTETGSVFIKNKCEALYFNATSDRRAKDNIHLSTFNGLDLVKALQIYNFNYAEQKTPSIGIMAQDAAEHDIEDFELVTNKEATGENGDFMSIKESKLVYVLWKAVQELSAEVDNLKAQLNNK